MPEPIILSLTLEVRLSPQLCVGNEAKSLVSIWEQYLGAKVFLSMVLNDASASAAVHS